MKLFKSFTLVLLMSTMVSPTVFAEDSEGTKLRKQWLKEMDRVLNLRKLPKDCNVSSNLTAQGLEIWFEGKDLVEGEGEGSHTGRIIIPNIGVAEGNNRTIIRNTSGEINGYYVKRLSYSAGIERPRKDQHFGSLGTAIRILNKRMSDLYSSREFFSMAVNDVGEIIGLAMLSYDYPFIGNDSIRNYRKIIACYRKPRESAEGINLNPPAEGVVAEQVSPLKAAYDADFWLNTIITNGGVE